MTMTSPLRGTTIRFTLYATVLVAGLHAGNPTAAAAQGYCAPPAAPVPLAPGALPYLPVVTIGTLTPTFAWQSVPYFPEEYRVVVSSLDTGFVSPWSHGTVTAGPGDLQYEASYWWWVQARSVECPFLITTSNLILFFRTPSRKLAPSGNLAFGNVQVLAGAIRTLTISNDGWSPLTVNGISYPAGFSGDWPGGTIAPGRVQDVNVVFTPSATTAYGGDITIDADQTSGTNTIAASGMGTPTTDARRASDFDHDGKSDVAVFRASTGGWYYLQSSTNNTTSVGVSWGLSADQPVPGDYDGDGKTDPTIFRPSTGLWAVLKSSTDYTSASYVFWGLSTDLPAPADYDGDGKTDPAIYRPSTGLWAMLKSSTGYTSASYVFWGLSTDVPMQADYDGDGKTDPTVFRPSSGGWYVLKSSTNYGSSFGVLWGLSTDVPVPGDYDGDGKTDPAVFRPSTGGWYVLHSNTNYGTSFGITWGVSTDAPAPADFDGDGLTDPAVFRSSTGEWLILKSSLSDPAHSWRFDEASGEVALDAAGRARNGVLGSGAHRVAGTIGPGALQFDVSDPNGFVTVPRSVAAFGTNDFTISFWLLRSPGASFAELVGNRGGQLSHGNFADFYADGDDIGFEIDEDGSARGYIFLLSSGAGVNDGAWHKITGVRAGPAAWLYIDGVLAASGTAADGVTADVVSAYDFTVGVNDYARTYPSQWLDCGCTFDDVRIYKRALSASEVPSNTNYSPYTPFIVPWGLSTDTPINKRP